MGTTMNKKQLIKAMHEHSDLSLAATERTLNQILLAITNALVTGEPVTLVGFGGFSVQKRKGRTGRDPRTGKSIVIASKNFPKFSAGERLKGILNDKTKP